VYFQLAQFPESIFGSVSVVSFFLLRHRHLYTFEIVDYKRFENKNVYEEYTKKLNTKFTVIEKEVL
jgi:hypothetical protein